MNDYHYLCYNCGFITPFEKWTHWDWDEEGNNLIPTPSGQEAFYDRCPVCQWDHWDDDGDPGIMDGTLAAMTVERERELENWGDRWKEVEQEVFGL